jgi:quercetin dioxygenase-like cupin family protein
MAGAFVPADNAVREQLDWGSLAWSCRPSNTGAQQIVAIEVTLTPGGGHVFHKHPKQEEMIYVIQGQVEQWLDREKRVMRSGDAVFIPADVVHASFNKSGQDAKLLAVLSPSMGGPTGYELEEVAGQAPWNTLQ